MTVVISLLTGYLLGSVSPAWILGRLLRGIDIRAVGTRNAGTTNAYHQLGLAPALFTAAYDLSKGIVSILIARRLGLPLNLAVLAGMAAFVGHIFPFYLRFRGGQGVATLLGIFFYISMVLFRQIPAPWELLASLAFTAMVVYFMARDDEIIGLSVIPLVWLMLANLLYLHPDYAGLIITLLAFFLYMWAIVIRNIIREGLLKLRPATRRQITSWRTLARPFAILIPVIYLVGSKTLILWILGIVGLSLIVIDMTRLISHGVNVFLFRRAFGLLKEKERESFSSMTLFIVAAFLSILLFDPRIAVLVITFLIFGDLSVKFFGAQYSRHFLWKGRSLEGLLAYFAFSLFFGLLVSGFWSIPLAYIIAGAAVASLTDLFSVFGIDDNFSVALITGGFLEAINLFLGI